MANRKAGRFSPPYFIAVLAAGLSGGCPGRVNQHPDASAFPPPDDHEEVVSCADDAELHGLADFDLCFGYDAEPPVIVDDDGVAHFDIVGTVVEPSNVQFVSCAGVASEKAVFIETESSTIAIEVSSMRSNGAGDLSLSEIFNIGEPISAALALDGFIGGSAIRVDQGSVHVVAIRFGTIAPDLSEFSIQRGEPSGAPIESTCGAVQPHTLVVETAATSNTLQPGDCLRVKENFIVVYCCGYTIIDTECSDNIPIFSWVAAWIE